MKGSMSRECLLVRYLLDPLKNFHHLLLEFFPKMDNFHIRNDASWRPLTRLCFQSSKTPYSTCPGIKISPIVPLKDIPCWGLLYSSCSMSNFYHMVSWIPHQLISKLVFSNARMILTFLVNKFYQPFHIYFSLAQWQEIFW